MILALCSKILPKSLRSGLTVLLICASLMVVFIWNELERQATRQQRELNAKKAKDDDFAQSLERYDHVGARGNSDDSWSPWAPGGKVKLKPKPTPLGTDVKTTTMDTTTTGGDTTQAPTTGSVELEKESLGDQNIPISPVIGSRPAELVEDGMEGCPAWYPDWDRLDTVKRKITLDSTKFIVPVLTYGPNNQLRGFRETVFLAIKLNRTIIPPPFYKHDRTDESKDEGDMALIIPPWHRIDLTTMATTMTTLDPFFLSATCNRQFDIFFKTKPFYCSGGNLQRFESLFRYLEMDWAENNKLTKSNGECHLANTIPDDKRLPTNGGPIHLSSSKYVLESFYKSDESCALWIFPYHCIQFKNVLKGPGLDNAAYEQEDFNVDKEADGELMQRIIRATPRPKYLRDIADQYIKQFISSKTSNPSYLGIHWRYNHGDWLKHCEHKPSPACTAVLETIDKPVEIAQEIALYLRARPHLTSLYIAAPLEEADLITAIKNELKDEFPIFTGESLLQFMLDSYPDCYWMKENYHDIFSSLEQEVCARSDIFLYAAGSSWSLNIVMERHAHNMDIEKSEENINLLYEVLRKLKES